MLPVARADILSFTPDGVQLTAVGWRQQNKRDIRVYNVRTGRSVQLDFPAESVCLKAAVSADGKYLATSSLNSVSVWNRHTGLPVRTLSTGSGGAVTCVVFSPDSKCVTVSTLPLPSPITGFEQSSLGLVQTWSIATGEITSSLRSSAVSIAYCAKSDLIALAGRDLSIWDLKLRSRVRTLSKEGRTLVSASPDGKWFFSAGGLHSGVEMWNIDSGLRSGQFKIESGTVTSMDVSQDGKLLAVGTVFRGSTSSGALHVWSITPEPVIKLKRPGDVLSVKFSPTGKLLAVGGNKDCRLISIPQ